MTETQVRALIRQRIAQAGSLRGFARGAGVSAPYVVDMLAEPPRRGIPDKVLDAVGVERIVKVTYRKRREPVQNMMNRSANINPFKY